MQDGLARLVEAELLYQRGRPPRARYIFKHALIQDAAYASLLKSTRQQYHQQMAQLLEAGFPRPSRPSRNCWRTTTPRRGYAQAVRYWQRAGQRACSAPPMWKPSVTSPRGWKSSRILPDTPERHRHELDLQLTLALALHASKGQAAPEVEQAYARARELCGQVEDTPQLFRALLGLYRFYGGRIQLQTSRELTEQMYTLAQRTQDR